MIPIDTPPNHCPVCQTEAPPTIEEKDGKFMARCVGKFIDSSNACTQFTWWHDTEADALAAFYSDIPMSDDAYKDFINWMYEVYPSQATIKPSPFIPIDLPNGLRVWCHKNDFSFSSGMLSTVHGFMLERCIDALGDPSKLGQFLDTVDYGNGVKYMSFHVQETGINISGVLFTRADFDHILETMDKVEATQ